MKKWIKKRFRRFKREYRNVCECLQQNKMIDCYLSFGISLVFLFGIVLGLVLGYIQCNYQLVPIA